MSWLFWSLKARLRRGGAEQIAFRNTILYIGKGRSKGFALFSTAGLEPLAYPAEI
jgi:hypothetical protein